MKKNLAMITVLLLAGLINTTLLQAQLNNRSVWQISDIMKEDFTGHTPRSFQWSSDSQTLYFYWRSGEDKSDSPYRIGIKDLRIEKADPKEMAAARPQRGTFSKDGRLELDQSAEGILLIHRKKQDTLVIWSTSDRISNLRFSFDESRILFQIENDLYSWSVSDGRFRQLTRFMDEPEESSRPDKQDLNKQDQWLVDQQKALFPKLSRSGGSFSGYRNFSMYGQGGRSDRGGPSPIYLDGYRVYQTELSPDNRFVTYLLSKGADTEAKGTQMPDYVTRSGYTEIRNTRSKVGSLPGEMKMGIYDTEKDSIYSLDLTSLQGIFKAPAYYEEYGRSLDLDQPKRVFLSSPVWSQDGRYGVMTAGSYDNKDRWIFRVDLETGLPVLLDHQHDEAWIGGPGIGYRGGVSWMPDQRRIWFQSEESGYSHIYTVDVETGEKKALTSGTFEVYSPFLSKDQKHWYFTSNEEHPGERHFYTMPLNGGERTRITDMPGSHAVDLSPDEKHLAITFSFANKPPELYIQPNKAGALAVQITDGRSEAFLSYPWRVPEFVTFEAEDGATVHARLYRPEKEVGNQAAVIFVHGAGYLQNAHKWWSTYIREYLFHNILVDNGYTVLDIDYRGSSGYGRDWRTGIYRWMGGKDLSDHVDGARWLVSEEGIHPDKIGIYGGSYGGFITLMAMFNEPDVFAAGAALRSVTDWAHYNHGYTANILNTPVEDSLAYVRSSPIYFAEGLQGHLLMCHGMLDDNVHFQDIVRLSQRLIDLGKDNWELAVYPLERHSFTDPDAWTDEYKRIFNLFQQTIGAHTE